MLAVRLCLLNGIPTLAVLLGILINTIQMRDMRRRFDSLENRMDAWFDRLDARFND